MASTADFLRLIRDADADADAPSALLRLSGHIDRVLADLPLLPRDDAGDLVHWLSCTPPPRDSDGAFLSQFLSTHAAVLLAAAALSGHLSCVFWLSRGCPPLPSDGDAFVPFDDADLLLTEPPLQSLVVVAATRSANVEIRAGAPAPSVIALQLAPLLEHLGRDCAAFAAGLREAMSLGNFFLVNWFLERCLLAPDCRLDPDAERCSCDGADCALAEWLPRCRPADCDCDPNDLCSCAPDLSACRCGGDDCLVAQWRYCRTSYCACDLDSRCKCDAECACGDRAGCAYRCSPVGDDCACGGGAGCLLLRSLLLHSRD